MCVCFYIEIKNQFYIEREKNIYTILFELCSGR